MILNPVYRLPIHSCTHHSDAGWPVHNVVTSRRKKVCDSTQLRPLLLALIPTWISNHIHYKAWQEITYPFPDFNGCAVEVWEWIINFIWYFTGCAITYPRFVLVKGVPAVVIVRRAGLLWSQQDFERWWSVPLSKSLTVLKFSFILFDLCLFITIFNFMLKYVPIVTFWIFTYHKIWILLIIFCFIWSYWIIYFLTCLEVFWSVVS